jgi:formylglycine-generating enzyme required for sulfatase activity
VTARASALFLLLAILGVSSLPPSTHAQPLPAQVTSIKDGATMVLVPRGRYVSGIAPSTLRQVLKRLGEPMVDFYATELPETARDLPAFYIDVFEVTNEQYGKFMAETGHKAPAYWGTKLFGRPRQPVVGVGWPDAEAYCAWGGKRLPREFEWEKAARGTDRRMWPWGNIEGPRSFNGRYTGQRAPIEVGSFPAGKSPYGIQDMAGNVWEMTASRWPGDDSPRHAMKGGSFLNTNADVRVTVRWAADDEQQGATWLGFRCVLDPSQLEKWTK